MSGIFDKLKDVGRDALGTFVVLDEDGNEVPADQTQAQPAAHAPGGVAPTAGAAPQSVAVPAVAAAADPEFVSQLKASTDASG